MARDTLAGLASDMCDAIQIAGGHAVFGAAIENGDALAVEAIRIVDVRAARLGATAADVIAALRTEATRRGMVDGRRAIIH